MNTRTINKLLGIFLTLLSTAAYAQPAWNVNITDNDHTIIIPGSIAITINNTPISSGDYLGVFYDSAGVLACGGFALWSGIGTTLTAYGKDAGVDNGFSSGEVFTWKIWKSSTQETFAANATYTQPPGPFGILTHTGNYSNNGLSALSSLVASQTNPLIANAGNDTTVCFGTAIILSAQAFGGTPPYQYQWSNSQSGASITVTSGIQTIYTVTVTDGSSTTATDQVFVSSFPLPNVTAIATPESICAGQSSTLHASGAVTFQWNTGALTYLTSVMPSTTSTYTVTGTDAQGCSNTASVSVIVNPLPLVNISASPASICEGGSSSLTASGANTYTWSHGLGSGATKTVTPNVTTTYTVTGTDLNGCTATASVTVTVNAAPAISASASPTSICEGGSSLITASGANTFTWSHGLGSGATKTVSPNVTTTYTVTGTDLIGCTATASVTVTVNATPAVSASASPASICEGGSSLLSASGANTYTWSHGLGSGATKTVTPNVTTTYTVTGTDLNGCTATANVTVSVNTSPAVSASSIPTAVCEGGSSSLTASGANTYTWSHALGSGATKTVTPTVTTTYTVSGTDLNGCTATASVTVTVNAAPAVSASASYASICVGSSSSLTAAGANTYSWSHGLGSGGSKTVTPNLTTTYTVTGTDLNGCTATANVTITVNASPAVSASALPASICAGNSSLLTASGAATYAWSHGLGAGATKTVTPNTTTTYAVTGTDLNGCSAMAQVILTVNPLPVADAGPNQTITSGNCVTLTASGGIQYQWNTNPVQSSQTILVCPASTQSYHVTVTDGNGCSATDQVQVTVTLTAPDTIDISIDTVWSCTLDTIPVPVRAQHFNNIGSIALTITIDTSLFSFAGLSEIHTLLQPASGGFLITNSADNKIIIAWFSNTSISTGDNMLFKLMLKSKNLGSSLLAWDFSDPDNNVITDINGLALPVKFHQGRVAKTGCANVSGSVNYLNAALTPLSSTQVWITRLSTTLSSTASNSIGGFSFSNLAFGEHQLHASSSKPWGGGNSNDALIIMKHFVGQNSLAGLYLNAADVDGSGGVNATDAMQVARRFVNLIPTLPAGDWVFDNPILNINAVNQTQNIQALCYGDVNGSYTNIAKNQLQAVRSVTYTVANEEWTEVPVSLQYSGNIHSISLVLNYDPNIISIQAINPVIEEGDFFINHNHGEIRIAWYALKGYHIQASAELIILKVKMIHKDAIQNWLTIGPESQVGNLEDDVLDVKVVIPDIVAGNNESLLSFEVYPVPARDIIRVGITAPFAGMGQFRIINLTGQVVMEILPIYCESGRNEALLNTNSLTPGVYFINLQFVSDTAEPVSQSKRLVIIR